MFCSLRTDRNYVLNVWTDCSVHYMQESKQVQINYLNGDKHLMLSGLVKIGTKFK